MELDKSLEATPEEVKITAKNRLFLHLILTGRSTVDAHKMAGYNGNPHAAYELRCRLDKALAQEAAKRGVSPTGIAADIAGLDALPVKAESVTVSEKLAIIDRKQRFVDSIVEQNKPKVTAFVIGKASAARVVDAQVIGESQNGDQRK